MSSPMTDRCRRFFAPKAQSTAAWAPPGSVAMARVLSAATPSLIYEGDGRVDLQEGEFGCGRMSHGGKSA
ncbi:hypothetical protein ACVW0K_000017 [Streptomyces filamentosus]